ncbi:MAG: hypothetical protein IIB06_04355 [Bacteroidetes bacterium]|nr:hypothetical protein [Bacteroidota bacterium]
MKRTIYIIFIIFFFVNSAISQNESIKSLVGKTNALNLDMWNLTDFAKEHIKEKNQLARFFYYWIGSNIKYDQGQFQKILAKTITNKEFTTSQDEYNVYENRKGVCAGYANLFKWFMNEIDIDVVVISGHIRDERNHYVELSTDDNFRHAWNSIKLNGKWILIDTTWGTSDETTTSEFYFDMKPEFAIITHYPENSKWQLLKKPLSLEEFNKSKFVNPIWFFVGFSDIPKLKADQDYYYFTFRNNPNNNWLVNLQYSSDNLNFNQIMDIKLIVQDGYTYYRFDKTQIPEKAFFKVNISELKLEGNQYSSSVYKDVINFKI